jgi:hypothetical protein
MSPKLSRQSFGLWSAHQLVQEALDFWLQLNSLNQVNCLESLKRVVLEAEPAAVITP